MEKKKEVYEKPRVDVVEFELEDNIAVSGDTNDEGAGLFEGLFN